ncbi:MAG: class I SAM-dependent methyltransferase [Gemmatimonadota bacterium]
MTGETIPAGETPEPRPRDGERAPRFADWTEYFDREHGSLVDYFRYHLPTLTKVARHAAGRSRILEAGVGTGLSSIALATEGNRVVAVDIDMPVLRGADRRGRRLEADLSLARADIARLPFRDDAFDVVFSVGVLEHFEPELIVAMLREQRRVASRFVIFTVPSRRAGVRSFGDENLWSWRTWRGYVRRAGLQPFETFGQGPSRLALLLPLAVWNVLANRFGRGIGFVCAVEPRPWAERHGPGQLKSRLIAR